MLELTLIYRNRKYSVRDKMNIDKLNALFCVIE